MSNLDKTVAIQRSTMSIQPVQTSSVRQGLLVLGMHRSGTSATAGVLGKLGCTMPADLMGPGIGNEKGHWESLGVVSVNDRILESGGSNWEDWDRFNPEWYASLLYPAAVENARAALRASFDSAPLFVLKDPRICRLVPLWLEAFDAEAINPAIVLCVRHPAEVAASLASRDGMDEGYAHLLWLRHMLEAEAQTRGRKRVVSHFDQLRQDWPSLVKRIGEDLGIVWPKLSASTRRDIDLFLAPAPSTRSSVPAQPPYDLMPWSNRAHAILKRWAEQGEDRSDDAELDEILRKFNAAADGFSSLILAGSRSLGAGGGHAMKEALAQAEATLSACRHTHDGAVRELECRLETALGLEAAATALLDERTGKLALTESTLRQREEEIAQTGRERDEARAEIRGKATQLESLGATLEATQADVLRLSAEHQLAQAEIARAERLVEDLQHRLASEMAEKERQLILAESSLRQREEDIARIGQERDEARAEIRDKATQLESVGAILEATQADMLRLSAEHQSAQAEMARGERLVEDLQHRLASEMAEKERQLILTESSLRQHEEDIAQIGQERDEARAEIRDKATQLESVGAILEATQADMLRLSAEHQSAQAEIARGERLVEDLQHRLASEMAEKTQLHDAVSTAVAHAAELMAARERAEQAGREELARHAEAERIAAEHHQAAIGELTRHQEWLGQINAFLRNRPQWWAIMPAAWQRRHEHAALRKRGLFDAEAYLRLYPDVAADGADPVQHYLTHGMAEGRRLIR